MPNEELLTSAEVAKLLRVHPKQIYRLLKQGLPAHRVGGEWRFYKSEVIRWSDTKETTPSPEAAPEREAPQVPPLLAANGDVVIELLLSELEEQRSLLGFVLSDRGRALGYLESNAVLFAGCHGDDIPTQAGDERLARIHLVTREIGIATPKESKLGSLAELSKKRFASRPQSAGVYAHLAKALQKEKLNPEKLQKTSMVLHSHREVVCAISRGEAQAGLTTLAWADRLGLAFFPLEVESYGLLIKAKFLGDPRVVRLCEVAQSKKFQEQLRKVSGYNASHAGDIRYDTV
jgi:putative molybdopterin biosynthesis protein